MEWKHDAPWGDYVERVISGYEEHRDRMYGPYRENKAHPFLEELCIKGNLERAAAMHSFNLSTDGVATILSNVTADIQQTNGTVLAPHVGGWYKISGLDPYTYAVCPFFALAWLRRFWRAGK